MAEPGKETLEDAPVKRKPGLELVDEGDDRKKIKTDVSGNDPPLVEDKSSKDKSEEDGENDEDDDYGDDSDEDEDEDEDEDVEHSNGKSATDTKGKGVVVEEDKGKGKLKVENGSDDESAEGDLSDEDSDLSDDPLAEVDLENILPSRTRRRVAQPGAYFVNDLEDDDDSDDSDA